GWCAGRRLGASSSIAHESLHEYPADEVDRLSWSLGIASRKGKMEGLRDHGPARPGREQEREAQRYLELAILLSLPCFVWGIWVCWPRIVMEHGRLEPWKIALQW